MGEVLLLLTVCVCAMCERTHVRSNLWSPKVVEALFKHSSTCATTRTCARTHAAMHAHTREHMQIRTHTRDHRAR